MKAISFLGFNPKNTKGYDSYTYINPRTPATHPDSAEQVTTIFALEAVAEFYRPDEFYVLLTEEAENFVPQEMPDGTPNSAQRSLADILNARIGGRAHFVTGVPSAHDIWDLFQKLTERVQPGDEVLFDITNGFRTLPVIAMTAAAFLRVVRKVTVRGIVYGAVSYGSTSAPVYDLLPLVELMDWTTATDKFLKTGEARELAARLRATDPASLSLAAPAEQEARIRLEALAVGLENVSEALSLTRPRAVLPAAQTLVTALGDAEATVAQCAKPFGLLLEQTRRDFQSFALRAPDTELQESLSAQWRLIEWYLDKKQFIQAVTLAREWVLSLVCWGLNSDWTNGGVREHMEKGLGAYMAQWEWEAHRRKTQPKTPELRWQVEDIRNFDEAEALADVWGKIAACRNNIAHCGMRRDNRDTPKQMADAVGGLHRPLRSLAQKYGLAPIPTKMLASTHGYAAQIDALAVGEVKGRVQGFVDKWKNMEPGPEKRNTACALLRALNRAGLGRDPRWQIKEWVQDARTEAGF